MNYEEEFKRILSLYLKSRPDFIRWAEANYGKELVNELR